MTKGVRKITEKKNKIMMKSKQQIRRGIIISAIVVLITATSFSRLTGLENIRAIHIVTLFVCGMGFGVLLTSLVAYFRKTE